MYKNPRFQTRVSIPPSAASSQQFDAVGNAIYEAGSDLIRNEFGAYKEKVLESGSQYFQSNISRYITSPRYYFQVNDKYVKSKLKMILFPFLHKGHWMRSMELAGAEFSFKPPIYDINAPDLYIPVMAFGTYLVLSGFFLGINGKFSPEFVGVQFTTGLLCWLLQVLLLEATLHSLGGGGGEIPLLDMVAYAGYTFVMASLIVAIRPLWDAGLFCAITLWPSMCMGIFLVRTMKRILISEVRSIEKHSTKRNYLLLLMVFSQFPLLFWLGNVVGFEAH